MPDLKFPYAGYHEPTSRRIRIQFGPHFTTIADTTSSRLVWEHPYYPQYYIPAADVIPEAFDILGDDEIPGIGKTKRCRLNVEGKTTEGMQIVEGGELNGFVRFEFRDMDAWFEEDLQIHCHPKDPYKRITTLPSTRHIVIKLLGTELANTRPSSPSSSSSSSSSSTNLPIVCLHETGLPVRYYLPKHSLNYNYIRPSSTRSLCPYKGEAKYYSVLFNGMEYKDLVWYYDYPTGESAMVRDLVCFYNEKVEVWVDGVKEGKVSSKFG